MALLERWLSYFKESWKLKAIKSVSDKDFSEIAAMRRVFPEATHQICYWHALRAVKQRLGVLRRQPAPYDAAKAHGEFDFIDQTFVPIGQLNKLSPNDVRPSRLKCIVHCLCLNHLFSVEMLI
jgi:hypothetical protein